MDAHFMKKVTILPNGCWEWLGSRLRGYGRLGRGGRSYLAHRFAYEMAIGPIPPGMQTVPVVCLVAEFVDALRKRRARRRSVEQADTDKTLTYLAALRATELDPAPWQEDFVRAAFVAERLSNVKPLPGRRLAAVPEQRTGDEPYDVEAEGL